MNECHIRCVLKYPVFYAALAQLVEQLLRKEKVVSSTPTSGTTVIKKVVRNIPDGLFICLPGIAAAKNFLESSPVWHQAAYLTD